MSSVVPHLLERGSSRRGDLNVLSRRAVNVSTLLDELGGGVVVVLFNPEGIEVYIISAVLSPLPGPCDWFCSSPPW